MSSKRSINHSWSVSVSKFCRKQYKEQDKKQKIKLHKNDRWRAIANSEIKKEWW